MSWKDGFIAKYGEEMHERKLKRTSKWIKDNPEMYHECQRKWCQNNSEKVIENNRAKNRKGGKYYEKMLKYARTGLQGERHRIRAKHGDKWRPYKAIIAPKSQIHHQWQKDSSGYDGVALVEADQHMHGFVNVIQILEGEITLFTEEEIRSRGNKV